MNEPHWEHLIHSHLDDALTEPEQAEFESLMIESASARRRFWELAEVHGLAREAARLAWAEDAAHEAPTGFRSEGSKLTRWLQWRPLWAAAAAVLVLVGVLWFRVERARTAAPFATLMATTNARWADPNVELALSSGERLAGPLRLESGRAEFQMVDGATVVLDGPASVRFAERKVVFVDEGRVFCQCPTPESRLSVITPQTKVVDLGTEFSVEARADASTRVAVLSGKVDVKSPKAGVLTAGEAVEVRRDVVVRLKPLTPEEMQALMPESVSTTVTHRDGGQNKLADPGLESALPSTLWRGTDECLQSAIAAGRTGNAVRIRAGRKSYPIVKQRVETGDVSGRVVQASAWAMSPADDPLSERQFAVLKIAFLNSAGREFACSARHFLHQGLPPGVYVPAQLAAQAPPGTRSVEVQLMLAASSLKSGSVCFDDASLVVAADAAR